MMLQKIINFLQECQRDYPKMVSFDYAQRESLISALEIDQAYISRLEAAYLQLYRDSIQGSGPDKEAIKGKMARESLERIKAGDQQ